MARRRARGLAGGGGVLRTVERLGVNRGVFGGSKGWFYVGTGLWTLRKVRGLAQRQPEILLRETLRPGDRLTIANGVATIVSAPVPEAQLSRRGRKARKAAEARPTRGRAARKAYLTQADLTPRARRR
jgi:hypothetical protein